MISFEECLWRIAVCVAGCLFVADIGLLIAVIVSWVRDPPQIF